MSDHMENRAQDQIEAGLSENQRLLKEIEELERKLEVARDTVKFVIDNSGSSTDYNKRARQCLKEIGE
jgi:chaperonin cofactor prefoldin